MMDVDPQQPQQYTILRIKRKRTDEPLDALGMFSEIAISVHLRFDMGVPTYPQLSRTVLVRRGLPEV
jgi:hypothetical protein